MPTEIPNEKRELIEGIINGLERLINVVDTDCLRVFHDQLAPVSQLLNQCGIEITIKTDYFSNPIDIRSSGIFEDSGLQVPIVATFQHRRIPKPRTLYQNILDTTPSQTERSHHHSALSLMSSGQPALNQEILNSTPSQRNSSLRLKDRPMLARLVIRTIRYMEKRLHLEPPLSNTGTKFQNEIEGILIADYLIHGTSEKKLARLRRLHPLYLAELETISEKHTKLTPKGVRAVLVTSLHSRFGGARRTFSRLLSDIEIVGTIIRLYSKSSPEISDPVLLAIAMEYYGTSVKYVTEKMEILQLYIPWLANLVSTKNTIPPGFRIPASLMTEDTTGQIEPLDPLDLQPINTKSDLWVHLVHLEEKFLVICGSRLLTLIALDSMTVLGSLRPKNKLGTMRLVDAALGNCRTIKRNGEEIVLTKVEVDEMTELTLC
ncbi:hypothetical protein TWF106_010700 [Orbilia oligospora]|uniref:Uncharacterized protein n=1 Tax=Orbilia oligospora TaxID=2813651 RepID=A0A7C8QF13_ORBOL|nr:hypothetical protein TWF106_010700 [Orbilia oligospora]